MKIQDLIIATTCLALTACSTIQVKNDYDPGYDYSRLKTFAWIPNPDSEKRNELVVKHFKNIMTEQLKNKGITSDDQNPDFLIAYHGSVQQRVDINNWGYRYPVGHGGFQVYRYNEGSIVVDMIDAKNKELIYRSSMTTEINRATDMEKRQKRIKEAVEEILKDFPVSK